MKYEMLYIIPTPFTENDVPAIQERVINLIKELDGRVEKNENLGDRKLAYEIKQIKRGFYILNHFTLEPNKIKVLEQKLKLMPEILRFQIIKILKKEISLKAPKKKRIKEENLEKILKEELGKEKPAKDLEKVEVDEIDELFKI